MTTLKFTFFLISMICLPIANFAQDSLLSADLSKYVHHFKIKENKIVGKDALNLLEKEAKENQYFLLGEFHGSPGISNLTQALIPILNDAGYNNFGLEVGPSSINYLKDFSKDPAETVSQLKAFNRKYNIVESDGYVDNAIPFFDHVEDAKFLQETAKYKWNLIGLDQEYYYGFIPLFDQIFDNLEKNQQQSLSELFAEAKDSIQHFYKLDEQDKKRFSLSVRDSEFIQAFLSKVEKTNIKNKVIVEAIHKTIEIYGYNATRKYFACNDTRIKYMKSNLKKAFDENNFDLQNDKLFLKMGGIHTSKGLSWLSIYEIGNTLAELAEFHGNKSIHITFRDRFYYEEDKVVDGLEDKKSYTYKNIIFNQFAKKTEWTIIDLRPVKVAMFYPQKYKVSEYIKRTFEQHDLILIPPLEKEGKPNY